MDAFLIDKIKTNKKMAIATGVLLAITAYYTYSAIDIKKDIKNDYTLLNAYFGMARAAAVVGGIATVGTAVYVLKKK